MRKPLHARPLSFVCVLLAGTSASCSGDDPAAADPSSSADAAIPDDSGPPAACDEAAEPAGACGICTTHGWVAGAAEGQTCEYLGIPFALPPTGERRWAQPEAAEPWSGVRDATTFGPACLQVRDLSATPDKSEDCLLLNVWTPVDAPEGPLPVMVFVHGGGYTSGATNPHRGLDLSEAGPVVVASMNYRLGALGFFAHPDLDAERPDAPSGSDGIRDQQLALRWIKDNVAAFNGDPNNVTLFGESAGSSSVGVHHVSPGSRDLATRFIMESGVSTRGVSNGIEPASRETMYATTTEMAADLCPGAADVMGCLRALPGEEVMAWTPASGAGGLDWVPVIEGEGGVLPEHPDALIAAGELGAGEVIVGTNRNEFGLFQLSQTPVATIDELRARVTLEFPARADEVFALYEPATDAEANQALVTMMTDVMFRCATRRFARMVRAAGRDVYLYSFEQGNAWHADELGYVFGPGFYGLDIAAATPGLSDVIQRYWVTFAAEGDPNVPGQPSWPLYEAAADEHLVLADPPSTGSGLQREACDFWDAYLEGS